MNRDDLARKLNDPLGDLLRAEFKRARQRRRAIRRRRIVSMLRYIGLIPAVLIFIGTAHAFPAIVEACHDGDTCTLITDHGLIHARLAGLDAPEERVPGRWGDQPFGDQARAALDEMIEGQRVEVEDTGQRSYRRPVVRITATIDGKPADVQREMVFQGFAWSATQFEPAHDRDWLLPTLELDAREHHRGLWADKRAVPPWTWRHEGIGK